jgi:hypothetical protein
MNLQRTKINDVTQLNRYIPLEVVSREIPADNTNLIILLTIEPLN